MESFVREHEAELQRMTDRSDDLRRLLAEYRGRPQQTRQHESDAELYAAVLAWLNAAEPRHDAYNDAVRLLHRLEMLKGR